MDIKMIWIPHAGKNAYLLSVIDVHTRRILIDLVAFSIKQAQVINLLSGLFMEYQYPDNVVIRSDNGSQLIRDVFVNVIKKKSSLIHNSKITFAAAPDSYRDAYCLYKIKLLLNLF